MVSRSAQMFAAFVALAGPVAAAPSPGPIAEQPAAAATKADLARAYLEFERTLRDHPPPPERVAEVNRLFDSATFQYFDDGYAATADSIRRITNLLLPPGTGGGTARPLAPADPGSATYDRLRRENERLLDSIEPAEHLTASLAACRARNALLTDNPSTDLPAQFLADRATLSREVAAEIENLRAGHDPYARRPGDYWRVIDIGGVGVPSRVHAPQIAARAEVGPVPLVIALHGAGADENMFMDGYGAGLIKSLADRHGFLVVSPHTTMVIGNPGAFDAIVRTMSDLYAIDPARVYLVGHSLGAITSAGLAAARPDRIAGVVCIAGAGLRIKPGVRFAPILLIAGEIDPIFPLRRLRQYARDAEAASITIEFREIADYGHTLIVGHRLVAPASAAAVAPPEDDAERHPAALR